MPLDPHNDIYGKIKISRQIVWVESRWIWELTVVALLLAGCRQSSCPDGNPSTGDLDDAVPQTLCSGDSIDFSPSVIDTARYANGGDAADEDAGTQLSSAGETVSVAVRDGQGSGRELANVDVFQCGAKGVAQAVAHTTLVGVTSLTTPGSCSSVSSIQLHCLTDYDGIARFTVRFAEPTQGYVCAKHPRPDAGVDERLIIENSAASTLTADTNAANGGQP
jgi:hypothetical protein